MIFLKYFILSCALFAGFSFSSEEKIDRLQNVARLATQDCRDTLLTPGQARDLAHRKFGYRSSKSVKFVEINAADILNSIDMPKNVLESISQGANINACDENGHTLLHYVCAAQNINLALMLINYGARLLPNSKGTFPQDLISCDGLNIDARDVACIRNLLIQEEHVSKPQKMRMRWRYKKY